MQIEIRGLNKWFGDHHVLKDISLSIENTHSLVIVGPSGGGKTTLLRLIAGLEPFDSGYLEINRHVLDTEEEHLRLYRKHVGMVFQAYNLFPHLTALENITLPLEKVHGLRHVEAEERAMSLLQRFQLAPHVHKKPAQLSGGQQQRIALSRAIAISPEFLILDEPTSALDPEFTAEVLDMIEELREEDVHLVLVTHEMGFARHLSDYVLFIDDGVIIEEGSPERVFVAPEDEKVRKFFDRVLRY
ncbi:MAG: amino acid ABC transporter ATP-binding protein [Alkalispirochaeta sp.]